MPEGSIFSSLLSPQNSFVQPPQNYAITSVFVSLTKPENLVRRHGAQFFAGPFDITESCAKNTYSSEYPRERTEWTPDAPRTSQVACRIARAWNKKRNDVDDVLRANLGHHNSVFIQTCPKKTDVATVMTMFTSSHNTWHLSYQGGQPLGGALLNNNRSTDLLASSHQQHVQAWYAWKLPSLQKIQHEVHHSLMVIQTFDCYLSQYQLQLHQVLEVQLMPVSLFQQPPDTVHTNNVALKITGNK